MTDAHASADNDRAIETYDVVLVGTSLAQSILAASLAPLKVLHLDPSDAYAGLDGNIPYALLEAASAPSPCMHAPAGLTDALPPGFGHFCVLQGLQSTTDASTPSLLKAARYYHLEWQPRPIYAASSLVGLLRDAHVADYLDFRALADFYLYDTAAADADKKLIRVPASKEDIFTSKTIPLLMKRRLMKFIKACATLSSSATGLLPDVAESTSTEGCVLETQQGKTIANITDWQLDKPYSDALVYTLGRSPHPHHDLSTCMRQIGQHVTSIGALGGDFPCLLGLYGAGSELSQAFCRRAAVQGATYRLETDLSEKKPGEETAQGVRRLTDETQTRIKTRWIVKAASFSRQPVLLQRVWVVAAGSWSSLCGKGEGAVIAIPPQALGQGAWAVHVQVLGVGAGICPEGQTVLRFEVGVNQTQEVDAAVEEATRYLEAAQKLMLDCDAARESTLIAGIQYCTFAQEQAGNTAETSADGVQTVMMKTTGSYEALVDEAKRVHALITGTPETFMARDTTQDEEEG